MVRIIITKHINAPKEQVFKTILDIRNFSKATPDIVNIEFLTEQEYGAGTKFLETRNMKGREVSTELEVTELEENSHIRMVSDTMGTIWDSIFRVKEKDGGTELILIMDANAYKLLPKITNPFMQGIMKKAIEKDMIAIKAYCEQEKHISHN